MGRGQCAVCGADNAHFLAVVVVGTDWPARAGRRQGPFPEGVSRWLRPLWEQQQLEGLHVAA